MHLRQCKVWSINVKQGTSVPCFYFYFTSSTNYLAKVLVKENNLTSPVVIASKEQGAGRGRYDRTFLSPKGGVYMSYITPAEENFSVWALYSAVAVKRVLVRLGVDENRLAIKWPNDVLLDGKKICGILPESVVKGDRFVIIGLGLNVNTKMEDLAEVKDVATSLYFTTGKKTSLMKATKLLVKELYNVFEEDKTAVLNEYTACLETLGKIVTRGDGITGKAISVETDGALVIENQEGTHNINWGEVCYAKLSK